MAQQFEVMSKGANFHLARMIAQDYQAAIVPAGSTQATAALLTADNCVLATASAGGVLLRPAVGRAVTTIYNNSGATQTIYPNGTEAINVGTAGAGVTLANGKSMYLVPIPLGWISNTSA